jgi:hypothetical protein
MIAAGVSSVDPYTVYAKARAVWEQARYPAYVSYTVNVRVRDAAGWKSNHYHLTYDSRRDTVIVNPVSDEELAHPHHVPPGLKTSFFGVPLGKPEARTDYLGVPQLAPNYSFGIAKYTPPGELGGMALVQQIRAEFHDPAPRPSNSPRGLKEIASVEAVAHDYNMQLAAIETLNGHPDYHLLLQPVREPKRYRLRDMWIDERTYFTDRVRTDGNFVNGPGPGASWTIDFAQIAGAPYIAREFTQDVLNYPGAAYSDASVSFEDVRASAPPAYANLQDYVNHGDSLSEP